MSKVMSWQSSQFCSSLILYHAWFGDTAENQGYRQCWQPFLLKFTDLIYIQGWSIGVTKLGFGKTTSAVRLFHTLSAKFTLGRDPTALCEILFNTIGIGCGVPSITKRLLPLIYHHLIKSYLISLNSPKTWVIMFVHFRLETNKHSLSYVINKLRHKSCISNFLDCCTFPNICTKF